MSSRGLCESHSVFQPAEHLYFFVAAPASAALILQLVQLTLDSYKELARTKSSFTLYSINDKGTVCSVIINFILDRFSCLPLNIRYGRIQTESGECSVLI